MAVSQLLRRVRAALEPDYLVEREIARGGMGVVFLASDPSLRRKVAVKILAPEYVTRVSARRFIREARILASLSHSHIVPIHSAGESDGISYYVMDYLDCETLESKVAGRPFSRDEVVKLARDLLDALELVHSKGIVHRDIKPSNIFIDDGRAIVADFGIATPPPDSEDTRTAPLTAIGTLNYMSPEARGGLEASPQTDIYATGVVLYEAATGLRWDPDGDGNDWTAVPHAIRHLIARAVEFDPENRWPTAREFRKRIWRTRTTRYRRRVAIGVTGAVFGAFAVSALIGDIGFCTVDAGIPHDLIPANCQARTLLTDGERLYAKGRWGDAREAYTAGLVQDSLCLLCLWRASETSRWYMEPPELDHLRLLGERAAEFPDDYRLAMAARTLPVQSRIDTLAWGRGQWIRSREIAFQLGSELFHRGPLINYPRQRSMEVFTDLTRDNPDFLPAWEFLAWGRTAEGDREGALEALTRLATPDDGSSPDPVAAPLRTLMNIGYAYRFGDAARLESVLGELLAGSGQEGSIIDDPVAAAGPRMLPAFASPEGAVHFGGVFATLENATLARSGLAAQMFGYLAMGMLDSARATVESIETGYGTAPDFRLFLTSFMAVTAMFDPEVIQQFETVLNQLRRYSTSSALNESERERVRWVLSLVDNDRSSQSSDNPGTPADETLATLLEARYRAEDLDWEQALSLSGTLRDRQVSTEIVNGAEATREPHVFFRSVLHLLRSEWSLARGDSLGAYSELRWYQNSDQSALPVVRPRQQEVDWALGPLAAWKKARMIDAMGGNPLSEVCDAYAFVARVWSRGDDVFAERAATAVERMEDLACPT